MDLMELFKVFPGTVVLPRETSTLQAVLLHLGDDHFCTAFFTTNQLNRQCSDCSVLRSTFNYILRMS